MKSKSGVSYSELLDVVTSGDNHLILTVSAPLKFVAELSAINTMLPIITERIQQDKKPAQSLLKYLGQIELHRDHLIAAYAGLFDTYARMITPQTRQSPIDKARYDMLAAMPDKMLRQFAAGQIGGERADSYVLPDDRVTLIDTVVAVMRGGERADSYVQQFAEWRI